MNGITPAVRTTVHEVCGTEHVLKALAYIDGANGLRTRDVLAPRRGSSSRKKNVPHVDCPILCSEMLLRERCSTLFSYSSERKKEGGNMS